MKMFQSSARTVGLFFGSATGMPRRSRRLSKKANAARAMMEALEIRQLLTATSLVFSAPVSDAQAGAIHSAITVHVLDENSQLDTTSNAVLTVSLASGPNGATLSPFDITAENGVATVADLILTNAGPYTLKVESSGLTEGVSSSFAITPAAASKLVFTTPPVESHAGGLNIVVAVEDQYDNVVTGNTSDVTIALDQTTATLGGTKTVAAAAGEATFSDLTLTKVGTYTLTAAGDGLTSATSESFGITPAAASKLVFTTPPAAGVMGSLNSIKVSVEDQYDNVVTDDTSNLTIALDQDTATLAGTKTVAAVAGEATFSDLAVATPGSYTLTVSGEGLALATSGSFALSDVPAKLEITTGPVTTVAGETIPSIVVKVEDAAGNLIPTDTSSVVIALNGTAGELLGTLTVQAEGGVATFSGLSIQRAGDYTVTVTDASLTSALSDSFTISPAAASKLVFTTPPTGRGVGALGDVVVAVEDQYDNVVTSDTSDVTIALNTTTVSMTGTKTATAAAGVATFSDLAVATPGTYTLNVTDGSLTAATSADFTLIGPGTHLVFTQAPGNQTSRTLGTINVEVRDVNNNLCVSDSSSVTLAIATGKGKLAGTATVTASHGVATFTGLSLSKNGPYTLQASSGSLTKGTTSSFVVGAKLVFKVQPKTTSAGTTFSVSAKVVDAGGHLLSTTVPVTIAMSGSSVTLQGASGSVNAVAGVATFNGLSIQTAGKYKLSVSSPGLDAKVSGSFTVNAGAATKIDFFTNTSNTTAGVKMSAVRVRLRDQYDNLAVGDRTPVTLSIKSGTGPADAKLSGTTAVTVKPKGGYATFSKLVLTAAGSAAKSTAYKLDAKAGTTMSATSSSFDVAVNVAKKLVMTGVPTTVVAGHAFSSDITVSVTDAYGNLIETSTGSTAVITVALNKKPAGATLTPVVQTASAGQAKFSALTLTKAGTYTLKATSPKLTTAVSAKIIVTAATV